MDTNPENTPAAPSQEPFKKRTFPKNVRYWLIGLTAAIVLCLGAVAGGVWYFTTTDARIYNRAQQLYEQRKYSAAEEQYQELLERYPQSTYVSRAKDDLIELYSDWGRDLASAGDFETAIEILTGAIETNPSESSLKVTLAEVYLGWGKSLAENDSYEKSVSTLEALLDKYPDSPRAGEATTLLQSVFLEWSQSRIALGDYEKATVVLTTARERFPLSNDIEDAYIDACLKWAKALTSKGTYQAGITVLENLLTSCPNCLRKVEIETALVDASVTWSQVLTGQESFEDAVTALENADRLVPGSDTIQAELPGLYQKWGENLVDQKNYAEGIAKLETITQRWPESESAQESLTKIPGYYLQWGDTLAEDIPDSYENAITAYSAVLDQYPTSKTVRVVKEHLRDLHMSMGAHWIDIAEQETSQFDMQGTRDAIRSALKAFQAAITVIPDSSDARQWVAYITLSDFENTNVFVLSPNEEIQIKLKINLSSTAASQGYSTIVYDGGTSPSKVETELISADPEWLENNNLSAVVYTIYIFVDPHVPRGAYRIYMSTSLYYQLATYYRSTNTKFIERQNATFYVIVP